MAQTKQSGRSPAKAAVAAIFSATGRGYPVQEPMRSPRTVDVLLAGGRAVYVFPAGGNAGHGEHRRHMLPLAQAHRGAGLGGLDLHAVSGKTLRESLHRTAAAAVDQGARPVKNHGPQAFEPR